MRFTLLFYLLLIYPVCLSAQPLQTTTAGESGKTGTVCLSREEQYLADRINRYRGERGLPEIPLSASLTRVAHIHVQDLAGNYKPGTRCNLHSWSSHGDWSSCCYTDDHRRASCMWDKPRELTTYRGDGYEIAFYSTFPYDSPTGFPDDALAGWKSSRGHNDLIVNRGKWTTAGWKAMGIGIFNGFAVVWFGELSDPDGRPEFCDE